MSSNIILWKTSTSGNIYMVTLVFLDNYHVHIYLLSLLLSHMCKKYIIMIHKLGNVTNVLMNYILCPKSLKLHEMHVWECALILRMLMVIFLWLTMEKILWKFMISMVTFIEYVYCLDNNIPYLLIMCVACTTIWLSLQILKGTTKW